MFSRNLKVTAIGALFLGLVVAASTHAQTGPDRTTYLTFSGAVAIPGVELTAFTHEVERPAGGDKLQISLGEAPAGVAPPIKAWFPTGERTGRQFIYETRLSVASSLLECSTSGV